MCERKTCPTCGEDKPFNRQYWYMTRPTECIDCFLTHSNPKANKSRMWVNGKYVSKKNALHKPGRYTTYGDVWTHTQIEEKTANRPEGEIYLATNPDIRGWVKCGMAISAEDRVRSMNTCAPEDYILLAKFPSSDRRVDEAAAHKRLDDIAECRSKEWFLIPEHEATTTLMEMFYSK